MVGVLPPGFAVPGPDVQAFIPLGLTGEEPRDQHYLSSVARLAPGTTRPQAEEELRAIAAALAGEHPETNEGWSVRLVSLQEDVVGDSGRTLFVLLAAVGLVLLVACANVALLSLARALERGHEASIRLALGATRRRLLRQFFMESLLVSAVGGSLGALLAFAGVALLKRTEAGLPRIQEVAVDPRVVLFACAATAAAALVSGLPSAWRRAHAEPAPDLAGTPARVAGGSRHALRDVLVVAEVAMAVVLLAGAGLLVRSYQALRAVSPGFDPRGVLVAPIFLDMEGYGRRGQSRTYYASLDRAAGGAARRRLRRRGDRAAGQPAGPGLRAARLARGRAERRAGAPAGVGAHRHHGLLPDAGHARGGRARLRRTGRAGGRPRRDPQRGRWRGGCGRKGVPWAGAW